MVVSVDVAVYDRHWSCWFKQIAERISYANYRLLASRSVHLPLTRNHRFSNLFTQLHTLTTGLKAYASDMACDLMETCRRACGGHGYSHASGIPRIYQTSIPACTYEGENTVMYLQCARWVVSLVSFSPVHCLFCNTFFWKLVFSKILTLSFWSSDFMLRIWGYAF